MSTVKKGFLGGFFGCLGVLVAGVVVLVVIIVVIAVATSGGGEKTKVVATAPGGAGQAAAGTQAQSIGTMQKVGDAEVTVHGVRESTGSEYLKPDPGMVWVIVDVSARNTGDDPYSLSSMLQTKVRDAEGRSYDMAFGADTRGDFDGTIPVAGTIRGEVAFEVPVDVVGLTFVFGQAFGTGQAFWGLR